MSKVRRHEPRLTRRAALRVGVCVCLVALACGGAEGGTGGASASGGNGAGGGGTGAAGAGGTSQGGGPPIHPMVLVDEGLVARYYFDEADSGQGPTEAVDAAPDPLPLAVTYVNENPDTFMSYTEDAAGNRGLRFIEPGRNDRASVSIDGTKILASLHGRQTMSYEVVADVQNVTTSWSRLSHIGLDVDHTLSLQADYPTRLYFELSDGGSTGVPVALPSLGRAVYHAVLDTAEAEPNDRVRIYVNGARLPNVAKAPPAQDQLIDLGVGRHYVVGNREIGGRTIAGAIYYSAIYALALTDQQILQNTALLLADDDTPQ